MKAFALEDGPVADRLLVTVADSLMAEAKDLREEADSLRSEASDLEYDARKLENRAKEEQERGEKLIAELLRPFIVSALERGQSPLGSFLIWPEIVSLENALCGEIRPGALMRIGLALELPVPMELMPRVLGRRVAL